jgi:hypothetical protein
MRRVALLSACVLVGGGLVVPATALADEEDGGGHGHDNGRDVSWIAEEAEFAVVLPDGTTFTEDSPPPEEEQEFSLPIGARLFIEETLYATEDGTTRGDEVGRTAIECTAQAVPEDLRCDIAWVLDEGSQLHGSVVVVFSEASEPTQFDIAVTGGTGEFAGASGVVSLTDTTDTEDPEAVSTTLYETHLD